MKRPSVCCLAALVVLPVVAAVAKAESGCEIRIGAVVASNSGRLFDPRLASLKPQFDSLFPYSSYRLLTNEKRHVQWGSRAGFDLPGGRYLLVIPKEYKEGRVSLKILLIDGSRALVDTVLALRDQGTFLVGGPRDKQGVLIIAIGARSVM